jgi:fumarate reductase subunit D
MTKRPVSHPALYWTAILHRLSGLALIVFLPAHFFVLSRAINGEARLAGALAWTDHPVVRLAEVILIFLFAAHIFGGLRVLALEMLPWRDGQKTFAAAAIAGAILAAGLLVVAG